MVKSNHDAAGMGKPQGECPECGSPLQFKTGKHGTFLGCTAYPNCQFIHNLHPTTVETLTIIPESSCPECSSPLAVKKGRFGMFIGCTGFPDCHFVQHDNGEPEGTQHVTCPSCQEGQLVPRRGRKGHAFYSCDRYPKCKYTLNGEPVQQECGQCSWPVLIKKTNDTEKWLQCPQKSCGFKKGFE